MLESNAMEFIVHHPSTFLQRYADEAEEKASRHVKITLQIAQMLTQAVREDAAYRRLETALRQQTA
jgi:hypothetical protein